MADLEKLLPSQVVGWSFETTAGALTDRLGEDVFRRALQPGETITSPIASLTTTNWLHTVNMVGVNVRTIQSFWNVVKYALTLPTCQSAVHLLPFWEPGVVDSLYGMASWRINPEFFSSELADAQPHLDTVEKQLKVTVNLLHALGKTVGMDVIPHTDRYSAIVLANPAYFEWLRRQEDTIVDHSGRLHEKVETAIWDWLTAKGPAVKGIHWPKDKTSFFSSQLSDADRQRVLFGEPTDGEGANSRRGNLVQWLFDRGYEPAPATMGPPYRGLEVDPRPEAQSKDSEGRVWRDYRIVNPGPMSRVFGPLARYKLYEALNDNRDWAIDFDHPRKEVWDYVCEHYAEVARNFNLDFMRGDMSHVQMRPEGVPLEVDNYYDLHKAVKARIRQEKPWFGYFAESFLAPPNVIAYGDEVEHLEQSDAEATLGDLQSMVVGGVEFMSNLRRYIDIAQTRRVKPGITVMTGDKDDPRFDEFYLRGNEVRLFMALFITDMPSYMGLGFECRDPHPTPAPNEHYTKLYVFKMTDGPKNTKGPYQWGANEALFNRLTQIRQWADELLPEINGAITQWLLPPDATAGAKLLAWTQENSSRFIFLANLDLDKPAVHAKLPRHLLPLSSEWKIKWSLDFENSAEEWLVPADYYWALPQVQPGGVLILERAE